jgi:P27 family predicted phage terminase small subunit
MQKTHDSLGRTRRSTQGAAGPKNLPDKEKAIKAGAFSEECPGHLGTHGKEWWNWAVRQLEKLGILDAADAKHIELCAETYEDYRMAQEDIDEHGRILSQSTDGGAILRRNPAFTTMEKARVTLRSFYSDLGLTPSARAKFGVADKGDDPLEELFRAARN